MADSEDATIYNSKISQSSRLSYYENSILESCLSSAYYSTLTKHKEQNALAFRVVLDLDFVKSIFATAYIQNIDGIFEKSLELAL